MNTAVRNTSRNCVAVRLSYYEHIVYDYAELDSMAMKSVVGRSTYRAEFGHCGKFATM